MMPVRTRSLGLCSCLKARSDSCRRSVCCLLHTGVLCLAFQHPFVSKVTSNRALRELVAEAKAEVMEEIEDSRDEAEDDDSSESASVSAALPALRQALHRVGLHWGRKPPAWLPKDASWLHPPDTHGRRLLLCRAPLVDGKAVSWPGSGRASVAAKGTGKQWCWRAARLPARRRGVPRAAAVGKAVLRAKDGEPGFSPSCLSPPPLLPGSAVCTGLGVAGECTEHPWLRFVSRCCGVGGRMAGCWFLERGHP